MDDKVILTGGLPSIAAAHVMGKATVYNHSGFVEDLPELNVKRWQHGCGHFVDENGQKVYLIINFNIDVIGYFKVYFVLGGRAQNLAWLDSSEFYVEGDTKWTLFTGLNPVKYAFTSLVLENRIFIIGNGLN